MQTFISSGQILGVEPWTRLIDSFDSPTPEVPEDHAITRSGRDIGIFEINIIIYVLSSLISCLLLGILMSLLHAFLLISSNGNSNLSRLKVLAVCLSSALITPWRPHGRPKRWRHPPLYPLPHPRQRARYECGPSRNRPFKGFYKLVVAILISARSFTHYLPVKKRSQV